MGPAVCPTACIAVSSARRRGPRRRNGASFHANGESYRGRKPSYSREQLAMVQDMLGQSASTSHIAKISGLSRQTVYRIKDDPAATETALTLWGL